MSTINLTDYQKKCIGWVLKEKYYFSDYDVDNFLQKSSLKNVQGWVLAKPPKSSNISKNLLEDVNKVLQGEPVDYVIGFKDFLGCKTDLSLKPLIPRVETEYWVEKALNKTIKQYNNKPVKVLDMFCGSGCIGIAVLKHIKNAHVTFSDISQPCIDQTLLNLQINNFQFSKKVNVVKSDIYTKIEGKFDVIFANPPYVPSRYVEMSKQLYFEPHVALKGGENGLDVVKLFLQQTPKYLRKDGILYMEFGDNQKELVEELINKYKYKNYKFKKDQFKKWRYVQIQL